MNQFEQWKYRHDEAWLGVKVILIAIPLIALLFLALEVSNQNTWSEWEEGMNKLPCEKVWESIMADDHYHQHYYDYYGDRCS